LDLPKNMRENQLGKGGGMMKPWSTKVLAIALFLAFAVLLGCEYTGEVTVVRQKGFYCKKNSKCVRGYEEHELSYFACKEDAEAAGYKCCPKHAAKMKPPKEAPKPKNCSGSTHCINIEVSPSKRCN
jgi:hypothetical protein